MSEGGSKENPKENPNPEQMESQTDFGAAEAAPRLPSINPEQARQENSDKLAQTRKELGAIFDRAEDESKKSIEFRERQQAGTGEKKYGDTVWAKRDLETDIAVEVLAEVARTNKPIEFSYNNRRVVVAPKAYGNYQKGIEGIYEQMHRPIKLEMSPEERKAFLERWSANEDSLSETVKRLKDGKVSPEDNFLAAAISEGLIREDEAQEILKLKSESGGGYRGEYDSWAHELKGRFKKIGEEEWGPGRRLWEKMKKTFLPKI